MEIKFRPGEWVNIPENCTAVIKDGIVMFEENKHKFKKGDFVIGRAHKGMSIFREYTRTDAFSAYLGMDIFGRLLYGWGRAFGLLEDYRLMADCEKQTLIDKLHEAGKDWDAEKCEIVDFKYVPKVGDCLKLEYYECVDFIECSGLENDKYPCGYKTIIDNGKVYENNLELNGWTHDWTISKITREELQAEFNKLGYEYDFNTHTANKIEWKPKPGYMVWYINQREEIVEVYWNPILKINPFRTRELAESALELLKNAKHY